MLTLVSLFDGIGGFPLGFERAGVRTVATVEIDSAAAAISARHFPDATHFPDVTEVTADDIRSTGFVPERGIITAGWPCQDFSVAGRRAGLAGERSGLWWHVARLLAELRPAWFVGENVPGLLSSVCEPECVGVCMRTHGGAMGSVLGSLAELGYGVAYRVLDAQHFGVAQRRERVFVVGHLGTPFGAAAQVLLEPEGGERDSAASSEAGAGATPGAGDGTESPGGAMTHTHTQQLRPCRAAGSADTGSTRSRQRAGTWSSVVAALTANGVGTCGADDNQAQAGHLVVHPLALRGREGGAMLEIGPEGGPYNALRAGDGGSSRQSLVCITGQVAHTLTSEGADASEDGTGRGTPIVAIDMRNAARASGNGAGTQGDGIREGGPSYAVTSLERNLPAVGTETVVRRLTEMECERLQGYPDGWTDGQSGSARYRQLGNSVAVPVVEWIARRLVAVDAEVHP